MEMFLKLMHVYFNWLKQVIGQNLYYIVVAFV